MHILQITADDFFSSNRGGSLFYFRSIVDELLRQDNVSLTIILLIRAKSTTKKKYKGCDIYECCELNDEELMSLIKEINPDVIHAHPTYIKGQLCRTGGSLGIPVVLTAHDGGIVCPVGSLLNCKDEICHLAMSHSNCLRCSLSTIRTGLYWYPLMRLIPKDAYLRLGHWLQRKPFILFVTPIGQTAIKIKREQQEWQDILCHCSRMIAPSQTMKEAMVRNGLDKGIVKVIPHGIPLPQYYPPFPSTQNGIKFFYVGRICYVKGLHVLLKAFNKLNSSNTELHIIGKASNKVEQRYEDLLHRMYQNNSRIIWHGKVAHEEVYNIINNFHISVSATICLESFGLNIAESLAMGKPVLASRCGGAEMQIEDGVNGWLVPTNNVNAMRQKMEEIIKMPESELAKMAGQKKVISIEEHCQELIKIYQSCLNKT